MKSIFTAAAKKPKQLYLTIDDGPSEYTNEIISLLKSHDIPAVFFFRGDSLINRIEIGVNAIKNGFLIGNHSYTHTAYSTMPNQDFFDEIIKTESLIDECYLRSHVKREIKVIRLPYGDRGAGNYLAQPTNEDQKEKVNALQNFMKQAGFQSLNFSDTSSDEDLLIDAKWTIDAKDYLSKHKDNEDLHLENLNNALLQSTNTTDIILMHDFRHELGRSDHLVKCSIQYLLNKNIIFLPIKIKSLQEMHQKSLGFSMRKYN